MPSRFLRFFAFLTLVIGVVTLFQAIKLYRSPTLLVEWSTASELDIAGFNVLRAENPEGPFAQVNTLLIPPVGDSLNGGDYRYEDTDVQGGLVYYYQLQEVELSGSTTIHGPIEAQATRGGLIEGSLSGLLIVGSIFVLFNKPRSSS